MILGKQKDGLMLLIQALGRIHDRKMSLVTIKRKKHTMNGLRLCRVLTTVRNLLKCPSFNFQSITSLRKPASLPSSGKEGT